MCHPVMPDGRVVLSAACEGLDVPLATGELMPAELVRPGPGWMSRTTADASAGAGSAAAPTVIVVADVYGPSDFYRDLCARVAARGLEAIMPDYFFRQGPLRDRTLAAAAARRGGLDEAGALDDLRALIAWARARPGSAAAPVGVLGFCMGATLALDLAALEDDLVIASYYGFPVPQATLVSPPPAPLELAPEMRGPILAFWGDRDEIVGIDNVERFVAAMRSGTADFDHHVYAGLGHGFLARSPLTDEPAEDDDPGRSWQLTLAHFERHLRSG